MRIVLAAVAYFAVVFAAGFALGPVRVLWLEPRWGPHAAVLVESPFLVAAIIWAARRVPRWAAGAPGSAALAAVGLGALAILLATEFAVGVFLRGMSATEQFARFRTPEGRVYLILLAVFAAGPLLFRRHRATPGDA